MYHYLWNTGKEAAGKVAKISKETGIPLFLADFPVPQPFMDYPSYDEGAAILANLKAIYSIRPISRQELEVISKAFLS